MQQNQKMIRHVSHRGSEQPLTEIGVFMILLLAATGLTGLLWTDTIAHLLGAKCNTWLSLILFACPIVYPIFCVVRSIFLERIESKTAGASREGPSLTVLLESVESIEIFKSPSGPRATPTRGVYTL